MMVRPIVVDGFVMFIPEAWTKFTCRGYVYRVVYGVLVRGGKVDRPAESA